MVENAKLYLSIETSGISKLSSINISNNASFQLLAGFNYGRVEEEDDFAAWKGGARLRRASPHPGLPPCNPPLLLFWDIFMYIIYIHMG